ncbi:YbaK/EbsC family protein, partial [Galactobacillus timonensis]
MSLESVRKQFEEEGIADRIMKFEKSSATVEEAAVDIGCKPEEICKTMAFDVDGKTVLIAMAGDVKVSNHKYKGFFHKKAKMLRG